jgi:hypothetical protein
LSPQSTMHACLHTWPHDAGLRPIITRNRSTRSGQACRGVCTPPACCFALRQMRTCPRQLPRGTRPGQRLQHGSKPRARSSACSAWPRYQPPVLGQGLMPAWRGGAPQQPPASAAAWRRGLLPGTAAAQVLQVGVLDGAHLGPRPCRWAPARCSSQMLRPRRAAAHSGKAPALACAPRGVKCHAVEHWPGPHMSGDHDTLVKSSSA